jgi:hypothetical protein
MSELYVAYDYVDEGYVEDNYGEVIPEKVKVFGFSRNRVISSNEETSQEIKRQYKKKFGRKAFAFPPQNIG